MQSPSMMAFQDALITLKAASQCRLAAESVALEHANQRILAERIVAPLNVPPEDNSAMDGYALAIDDWQPDKAFVISQRIAAGTAPSPLVRGTCVRLFTGAQIPFGADTVIMQENAHLLSDGQVVFPHSIQKNDHIRAKGQDRHVGDLVFEQGQRLSAQHIGLLASLGLTHIQAYTKLKVGLLTTGDELIRPGSTLAAGQLYNSNATMLKILIETAGYDVVEHLHARDTLQDTQECLKRLAQKSDVILSSGGVSVGEEDHVKQAVNTNGSLSLWKIAIKPGKPLAFGSVFHKPFMGLPGNPSSTLVTFHWFARIMLAVNAGAQTQHPLSQKVHTTFCRNSAISRDEFLRAKLDSQGRAIVHAQQSSGALFASCQADGYLHIKAGDRISAEQTYDFYPFTSF